MDGWASGSRTCRRDSPISDSELIEALGRCIDESYSRSSMPNNFESLNTQQKAAGSESQSPFAATLSPKWHHLYSRGKLNVDHFQSS